MNRALVTGANGFVGASLVRSLLNRGVIVRVFVRANADRRVLQDLQYEEAIGDLRDRDSIRRALKDCDALFHCGAAYSLWKKDRDWIYATNVEGTNNALEAALEAGLQDVVYTSSVAAIGKKPGLTPGNENHEMDLSHIVSDYKKSKYLAEKEAMKFPARGLPVKIVNPSAPIGPYDAKPTPTGRMIVEFLNGRVPAYIDTGLNVVAVEDVAEGHLLAAEKARPGERYILGNRNMTLRELYETLAKITGRRAPNIKMPRFAALMAAYCSEGMSSVMGKPPAIPVDAVKMAHDYMFYDPSKAVRELGMPQTPAEIALERAVRWFTDNGYVKR